jgi:uncharacterized membrane protein YhaH (DUF805 family)
VRSADLFLSFEGRLDRARWRGAASLFVVANLATFGLTWWLTAHGFLSPAGRDQARIFVQIFTLVPWLAIDWKRFQDRGQPGRLALICPGLYVASRLCERPLIAAHAPANGVIEALLSWAQFGVALWLIYALAIASGTEGPNAYGPDPRGSLPAEDREQGVVGAFPHDKK